MRLLVLYIGPGGSAFCNYWAKAYTAIVKAIAARDPNKRVTSAEDLKDCLSYDPSGLLLAARLALCYAATGTLHRTWRKRILQLLGKSVYGDCQSHRREGPEQTSNIS